MGTVGHHTSTLDSNKGEVSTSAKNNLHSDSNSQEKSLMKSEDSSGPRLLPCGAPDIFEKVSEDSEPIITQSFRSIRYDFNQQIKSEEMPNIARRQ